MLIKEKILFSGKDIKIKLPLSTNTNLSGLQQSISEYIERETGLSINPATDGETFRLLLNNLTQTYTFKFHNGTSYSNTLLNAGFTTEDIEFGTEFIKSSFYIMQVFDSINGDNQTLLHSSFYNGYNITGSTSTYTINSTLEFPNLYIEEDFLNSTSASTITVYSKFYFFNAKLGKLHSFLNESSELLTTEDKMYFPLKINKNTRRYSFNNGISVSCKEMINVNYNQQINDSLDIFSREKPTYPTGNTFTNTGIYIHRD